MSLNDRKPFTVPMQHDHSQVIKFKPKLLLMGSAALLIEIGVIGYLLWQVSLRVILIYFSGRVF